MCDLKPEDEKEEACSETLWCVDQEENEPRFMKLEHFQKTI